MLLVRACGQDLKSAAHQLALTENCRAAIDNTGVFRDIKRVTSRTVLSEQPDGLKVVEVEQMGEVRILWRTVQFRTLLKVTEDARDPEELTTAFDLIRSVCRLLDLQALVLLYINAIYIYISSSARAARSVAGVIVQDVLGRFNGGWFLKPIRREGGSEVVGTLLRLEQDVTPRGGPCPSVTHAHACIKYMELSLSKHACSTRQLLTTCCTCRGAGLPEAHASAGACVAGHLRACSPPPARGHLCSCSQSGGRAAVGGGCQTSSSSVRTCS